MKPSRPKQSRKSATAAAPGPPARTRPWWHHAVVVLALLAVNLLLYHPAIRLGFLSVDDADYVQNNPYIAGFNGDNLRYILTTPYAANYAPANLLSYALDAAVSGGKQPLAFHLSNVLWHGWVACMVYLLAFTIRPGILTAAGAALLFLLHPTHVEVVAWVSSRKDLVATGFAALSMAAYLIYRRRLRLRWWWYAASLAAFLTASAGKQSVLLLPAVMLVWDLLVEKRRAASIAFDKIPFLIVAAFFGWMTWQAQPGTNQARHLFVAAMTQLSDLWLLTGFGQYALYRPAPDPAAWSAMARLGIILVAIGCWALPLLFLRARAPARAALCYWVLIQMVPPMLLSFIVPITDRYLFLPSVGVCILVADLAGVLWLLKPPQRWMGPALVLVLSAVWAGKTWNYLAEWTDPRSVWYGAHLKMTTSQVNEFLGDIYQDAGDRLRPFVESGAAQGVTNELPIARAVLADPAAADRLEAEWLGRIPGKTNTLAYRDRLWALAWEQYEKAGARRGRLSAPNLFMNRGRLLVSQGKFRASIAEFETALAFAENSNYAVIRFGTSANALYAIGVAHWHLREYREAERWLIKAQDVQKKSGHTWIPELDLQVERIKNQAAQAP